MDNVKQTTTFDDKNGEVYKTTLIEPIKYKDNVNYIFNVGHAQKYGLDEAIMINNFIYWIDKNFANETNFYDDNYWTFNSVKAFQELYPFWSESHIRRVLKSLIDKEILITGNYNKVAYDRTLWYAFKNPSLFIDISICQKRQIENSETTNRNVESDEPIPSLKPTKKHIYINKINYLENISLTAKENDNLVNEYGQDKVNVIYKYLSDYKLEKAYKTKSDYLTIKRWVIDAVNKKGVVSSGPVEKYNGVYIPIEHELEI